MAVKRNPVDLPARDYFTPDELMALIDKATAFRRVSEEERSKHYKNTDSDRKLAAMYERRITFWNNVIEKLVELANVPQRN